MTQRRKETKTSLQQTLPRGTNVQGLREGRSPARKAEAVPSIGTPTDRRGWKGRMSLSDRQSLTWKGVTGTYWQAFHSYYPTSWMQEQLVLFRHQHQLHHFGLQHLNLVQERGIAGKTLIHSLQLVQTFVETKFLGAAVVMETDMTIQRNEVNHRTDDGSDRIRYRTPTWTAQNSRGILQLQDTSIHNRWCMMCRLMTVRPLTKAGHRHYQRKVVCGGGEHQRMSLHPLRLDHLPLMQTVGHQTRWTRTRMTVGTDAARIQDSTGYQGNS